MGRKVNPKPVQVHYECACGWNAVDHILLDIKWKDFKLAGIKRKIDKRSKQPFLTMYQYTPICYCKG